MADQKITDLVAVVTPQDTDLIEVVTDISTTPTNKKSTWTVIKAFLKTYIDVMTSTFTNKTINSLTNYIDADATHLKVFLNIGRAGVIGDALYVTGWNVANSCPEVGLAKANSLTTLPCAGVLESAGSDGTVQSSRVEGILSNVNTNAWSAGTRLYLSATTAGVLTSTRPTTPNYDQAIATVLFQNATTGILDVIRTAFVGTMGYADTASYVPVTRTLTINGTALDLSADRTWTISVGASLWTAITGTRASNTTITVATDLTAIFKKGMIVRWQEGGTDKVGMVSIPSTYSSPNTTITIIGDTCASIDAGTFKYSTFIVPTKKSFAIAGNIGATASNVANAFYADKPYRVIGAELSVGTAGTTNSTTIDINKGGTTIFTTKPTLASTVAFATTPFTADTATSLALGDKVTIDIDAIQTTNAQDLYADLILLETRFLTLS